MDAKDGYRIREIRLMLVGSFQFNNKKVLNYPLGPFIISDTEIILKIGGNIHGTRRKR